MKNIPKTTHFFVQYAQNICTILPINHKIPCLSIWQFAQKYNYYLTVLCAICQNRCTVKYFFQYNLNFVILHNPVMDNFVQIVQKKNTPQCDVSFLHIGVRGCNVNKLQLNYITSKNIRQEMILQSTDAIYI